MAKFGIASGPAGTRRKFATALAAAGALLLSSGMVMAAAPGAVAAPKDDKAGAAAKPNKGQGNNNGGGNQGGNGNGGNQGGNGNGGNGNGGNGNGGNGNGGNGGNTGGGATKFYVCKWVGQVAVGDEAHHIVPVSGSPIGGEGWFNDNQGPSYVLELEEGEEPSLADCPPFDGGNNEEDVLGVLGLSVSRISDCDQYGSITAPVSATDGVSYSMSPGSFGDGLSGTHTVTATLDLGVDAFDDPLPPGWLPNGDRSVQIQVALGDFRECDDDDDDDDDIDPTLVSPRYPSTTDATCSRNGRLVVPNQPQGVQVERTGSVPGTVTFTFSPAEGYAFPKGTDREVSLQVEAQLTGDDCIKGVETSRPKPTPGTNSPVNDGPAAGPVNGGTDAEVLGEQAVAVPTAVAAGLGDTMTAASTTGSPQLAQALVAGGLLMLVAGGATGLGRRTRGAHES